MATKKKGEESANSNVNKNTNINNNINYHTHNISVKVPKTKKDTSAKKTKPNWILKAVVVGLITLAVSIIAYYVNTYSFATNHEPSVKENSHPSIKGQRAN